MEGKRKAIFKSRVRYSNSGLLDNFQCNSGSESGSAKAQTNPNRCFHGCAVVGWKEAERQRPLAQLCLFLQHRQNLRHAFRPCLRLFGRVKPVINREQIFACSGWQRTSLPLEARSKPLENLREFPYLRNRHMPDARLASRLSLYLAFAKFI